MLRIFHAGRNPAHRARDRALVETGIEVVYVVPRTWPEPGSESVLSAEPFPIIEMDAHRPGDINRHCYVNPDAVATVAREHNVDLVDVMEEPFSRAAGQLIPRFSKHVPVVMYSAQNLDKRWPPPFWNYERRSFRRVSAFYPCSRQAASVLRSHGYGGLIEPIPLGYDDSVFAPGSQSLDDSPVRLALVGRMVPEKGVLDAIRVLAHIHQQEREAVLTLTGSGSALDDALALAKELDVSEQVEYQPWLDAQELADLYRQTHVVLAPSRSTPTWVEQFGRMIVEAQACGCVVAGYWSGSIPEVAGDAGVLVSEGDAEGLAAAVARVMANPSEYSRHRDEGLRRTEETSWRSIAEAQASVYWRAMKTSTPTLIAAGPRDRRIRAIEEFGLPAIANGQERRFALPVLRDSRSIARALGWTLDQAAELVAAARPKQ